MPMYNFTCEICGHPGREWRKDGPPRFCSKECKNKGLVKNSKRQKWIITPEMEEEIRSVYRTKTESGEINALAEKFSIPRYRISRYASVNGLVPIRHKEPDWTELELKILEGSAQHTPERIQKILKKAGYNRSITGIALKRKRMRYLKNLNGHTALDVAECFGVDAHCITRWIKLGYLKASRRGTKRTAKQGGDQWYIKDKWIRDFIINYTDEIDIRKVDKYWFVDLLAGNNHFGTGSCGNKREELPDEDTPDYYCVDPDIVAIFVEAANY